MWAYCQNWVLLDEKFQISLESKFQRPKNRKHSGCHSDGEINYNALSRLFNVLSNIELFVFKPAVM